MSSKQLLGSMQLHKQGNVAAVKNFKCDQLVEGTVYSFQIGVMKGATALEKESKAYGEKKNIYARFIGKYAAEHGNPSAAAKY